MSMQKLFDESALGVMLKQYHDGKRDFPSYDDLAGLLSAQPRVSCNPEENAAIARDAQAIVDADVKALASGRTLGKGMSVFEQNAAMRAALDKIYHLRQIDWEPTRVCGIINQCIMAIGAPAAAPQVVAESALVMASKQALEYIEGVAARTDKDTVWERCEAICSDLRSALLGKPQVVADERGFPEMTDDLIFQWAEGYVFTLKGMPHKMTFSRPRFVEAVRTIIAHLPAAARVQADTSDNAPWLTLAHIICADAGVPPGHISDRLKALRDKLEAPVQAQEPVAETYTHTMSNGRGRPDDPTPFETVCVRLLRNDLPAGLKMYAAPVQPVAVPDGAGRGYSLGRSIIYECPALVLPQSFIQKLGAAAQIIPLHGMSDEAAKQLVSDCNSGAPAAQGDAKDAEVLAALQDITDDICERFDMSASSTNPGIKNCVERARAAIAAKGES